MFRFTIRDVLWLTVVVAVGLTGILWVNRFVYSTKRLDRLYHEEQLAREKAEALAQSLQNGIARLRSQLSVATEPNP